MFSHEQVIARQAKVEAIDLPNIPPQVDLMQLDAKLHLLSQDEYTRLIQSHLADGRYSKHDESINTKHTIAILKGEVHTVSSCVIGEGSDGIVKASQNALTGEWEVCKILKKDFKDFNNEAKLLDKMGLLAVTGELDKNIVHYKSGRNADRLKKILFMQYLPGYTLNDIVSSSHSAHQWLQMMIELLRLTKELVKKKIVHGDFHQGNILYDFIENKMHVIDFEKSCNVNEGFNPEAISKDISEALWCINYWLNHFCRNQWLNEKVSPVIRVAFAACSNKLLNHTENIFDWIGNSLSWLSNLMWDREVTYHIKVLNDLENFCDKIISELSILGNTCPDNEKIYNIGVLDITDYKNNKVKIDDLKKYAEMWLIDRNNTATLTDYLQCRQELQRNKIWIGDKVFKHPSLLRLTYHLSEMCKNRHPGCYFIFVNAASGMHLDNNQPESEIGVKRYLTAY